VDLSKTLVGIWDVVNLPASLNNEKRGTAMGQVEFKSDGSYVMLNGAFLAVGSMAPAIADCSSYAQWESFKFKVIDGVIQFERINPLTHTTVFAPGSRIGTISQVTKSTINAVTFYNDGTLSRLVRVTPVPDGTKASTPVSPFRLSRKFNKERAL